MAPPLQHRAPTFGARIPLTHGDLYEHSRASACDSCGLRAAAQHFVPVGRSQIKPVLIAGEGQNHD